jgi:positive regulator of sigma E activity
MRLGPGDWVEVEVPQEGALGKGALLFGLPIALFVGVYLALAFTQSDVMRAAGGFGGLAAGFGIAVLVSRLWKEPAPRVTRVYRDPELVSVDPPASSYP